MMEHKAGVLTLRATRGKAQWRASVLLRSVGAAVAIALLLFLSLYNLTNYPVTWFDEGSHLHVPKALVRFGVYADYSSEGFRYDGPIVSVGPTVMLPIAAAFKLFGIGLLQARLVMVLYLLAAIYAFYRLALVLGGRQLAWVATALLVTSREVSLIEYGRQVLGEVPGLFFMAAGLALWLASWEKAGLRQLMLVGLLMGLSMVTKKQYLLVLVPTLGLAWLANQLYYRTAPQRIFILLGLVAVTCFALWQIYLILYLSPATASQNLEMLRQQSASAAFVFSPGLMEGEPKVPVKPGCISGNAGTSVSVWLGHLFAPSAGGAAVGDVVDSDGRESGLVRDCLYRLAALCLPRSIHRQSVCGQFFPPAYGWVSDRSI